MLSCWTGSKKIRKNTHTETACGMLTVMCMCFRQGREQGGCLLSFGSSIDGHIFDQLLCLTSFCEPLLPSLLWGQGRGGGEIIYLSLHCHHQNNSCIKMGSDESHFNVSLIQ